MDRVLELANVARPASVLELLDERLWQLAGRAKQIHAVVKGSGDMVGAALTADDVQLTADTAGTVTLGSARSARIVATGSGDVTIGGTPACTV